MHRCKVLVPGGDAGLIPMQAAIGYQRQIVNGEEQLLVSIERDWLNEVLRLADHEGNAFQCIYEVRAGNDDGSDIVEKSNQLTIDSIRNLVMQPEFHEFLEVDPRHNFSILNLTSNDQVTLDEHNFIIARGAIDELIPKLQAEGFKETVIELPTPHVHQIHDPFDDLEPVFIQAIKDAV